MTGPTPGTFMLDTLRSRKGSFIIGILFGIIILTFIVSFGPGSFSQIAGTADQGYAARINGVTVDAADFQFAFNMQVNRLRQVYGNNLDANTIKGMRLKDNVMDELINTEILRQYAERMGFAVGDDEVLQSIAHAEAFKTAGKFDMALYEKLVRYYYRTSPKAFEMRQRRVLLADKARAILSDGAFAADEEAKSDYIARNERVKLDFVKFDPAAFEGEAVAADKDADEFLAKRLAEAEAHYNKFKTVFYETKEAARAQHILIKTDDKTPPDQDAAAKAKIEALLKRAQAGEDFAELAKASSEDTTTAQAGGDLGFFERGRMVKAFEDAAFGLKVGELSGVVKTQFGYHIIKVTERRDGKSQTFDEAKRNIALKLLKGERAKELAKAFADEIAQKAAAGQPLAVQFAPKTPEAPQGKDQPVVPVPPVAVKDPKYPEIETTDFFSRAGGAYIAKIGSSPELMKAAFMLQQKGQAAAQAFEVAGRVYVVQLADRVPADMAGFEAEREAIRSRLIDRKRDQILEAWLKREREAALVDRNMALLTYEDTSG